MSLYLLSGRFAQVTGLIVGLLFAAMWVGSQIQLPLLSAMSRAFIEANGTTRDMLAGAGVGFFIFVVGTAVFAAIGDASNLAKNQSDLRKSGWR